jgi:hypothetical protein
LESIDAEYQKDVAALKEKLAEKLIKIVGDKKSQVYSITSKRSFIKKGELSFL